MTPRQCRVQQLIHLASRQLAASSGSLDPRLRHDIFSAIGPTYIAHPVASSDALRHSIPLVLSTADRVRTLIHLLTATKVSALWQQACAETDAVFPPIDDSAAPSAQETAYQPDVLPLEEISIYDVPRRQVAYHILETAHFVLGGSSSNFAALRHEANEWRGTYARPPAYSREYFIKAATLDALFAAIGSPVDEAPAENARRAYAGILATPHSCTLAVTDPDRERDFWQWWLNETLLTVICET